MDSNSNRQYCVNQPLNQNISYIVKVELVLLDTTVPNSPNSHDQFSANNIYDDELQPIRRERAKSLYISKLQSPSKKLLVMKTKSLSPGSEDDRDLQPIRRERTKSLSTSKLESPTKKLLVMKTKSLSPGSEDDRDLQPIRRERAKSLYISKLESPTKKLLVMKTNSLSPSSDNIHKTPDVENNTQKTSPVNRVKKTIQPPGSETKDGNKKDGLKIPEAQFENRSKTKIPNEKSSERQKDMTISPSSSIVDEADLEVERVQLVNSPPDQFHPIKRSRSYSQGFELKKNDRVSYRNRSKSVIGRSKRRSKSLRRRNLVTDSFQFNNSEATKIDITDLKVGDLIWGKMSSYPYWPCLIVSDPETSEFRKFKLLRAMPHYHVRFFGDKGKRAWISHVIPYKEANDLDKFAEEYRRQGVPASTIKDDFVIKKSQRKKWDRGVAEAELLKNESLQKKLNFFDEILANASSNASVSSKASESSDENSCSSRDRIRSSKRMKKRETISLRESLIISCINNVVKYTSWDSGDSTDDSIYEQQPSSKKSKKRRNSSDSHDISDSKLGFELLDIPCLDNGSLSTHIPEHEPTKTNERKSTEESKQSVKDKISQSPKKRSKSRCRIENRRNQLQTPSNLDIPTPKLPATPPKIL